MILSIKNMVCQRCIWAVKDVLDKHLVNFDDIKMGQVDLVEEIDGEQLKTIRNELNALGFEILLQKDQKLVNQIKTLLIKRLEDANADENLSAFLSQRLATSYESLSRLFSQVNGTSIEKHYSALRVEKAKELLHYGELDNTQIAYELAYSSPAHFSSSFKSATGLTPSKFRSLKPLRNGLANV